jgi:hypothetical protein
VWMMPRGLSRLLHPRPICGIEKKRCRMSCVWPFAGSSEAKKAFDEERRKAPPGNRGGGPLAIFPERTGWSEAGVSRGRPFQNPSLAPEARTCMPS